MCHLFADHSPTLFNLYSSPLLFTQHQRGSTLVLSLLLLVLMSALGLQAMEGATIEEKMASNFRFSTQAFYAAEAGLQLAINNHTDGQITPALTGNIGEGEYSATVTQTAALYTVESFGSHPNSGSRRTITALLSGPPGTSPTIESWLEHE
jgi:hypothetical protein